MTSSWWQRHVELKFIEMVGNWSRGRALGARGDRGDLVEWRAGPCGHRSCRRRPWRGGRRHPARRRGCRGGGGGRSCPGGRGAHQQLAEEVREGRGRPRRPKSSRTGAASGGQTAGSRARFRRLGGSRHGAVGEVGEELEAERLAAMASSGAAGGDGTVRRPKAGKMAGAGD